MYSLKIRAIKARANKCGWQVINGTKDPTLLSFRKMVNGHMSRINVWFTTMTVGTCIHHPKQGKTQLFRRKVDLELLSNIFKNPRAHTGRGYKVKQGVGHGKKNNA